MTTIPQRPAMDHVPNDHATKVANKIADHLLVTALMHVPNGMTPEAFIGLVIIQVRNNQSEKIKQVTQQRGLQGE